MITAPEWTLAHLQQVYQPQVVGIPPINPVRDLMQLPDGEIRHYGFKGDLFRGSLKNIYLSSKDAGLSWQERESPALCPGAVVQSPWSGDYFTILPHSGHRGIEEYQSIQSVCEAPGIYCHRSTQGVDGPYTTHRVSDDLPRLLLPRQPLALTQRRRWVLVGHAAEGPRELQFPVVFLSDDDGFNWRLVKLPRIEGPEVQPPHAGIRWVNCGPEPTVAELSDGSLYLLIRTAYDQLWESRSYDGGETWSAPIPSRFYSTTTTPLLHRLSDGRLLIVWNNTTPLPEKNHSEQANLSESERSGFWEDIFTNRDALHAAISSDDGKSWTGFRELFLNERRNDADYRTRGGSGASIDRSVHQSQLIELPMGRILLAFGQHPECRRMILFSLDWLAETDRKDDFSRGLTDWSTHNYYRSIEGGFRGIAGHCALNRRSGATLIPDPTSVPREVLQIARHRDPRLEEERQGATWNFPASTAGEIRLEIYQPSSSHGTILSLLDRWVNPSDPVLSLYSSFQLLIEPEGVINGRACLQQGTWHQLVLVWDLAEKAATVLVDDHLIGEIPLLNSSMNGLSYLHLQSAAQEEDCAGLLLASVQMKMRSS